MSNPVAVAAETTKVLGPSSDCVGDSLVVPISTAAQLALLAAAAVDVINLQSPLVGVATMSACPTDSIEDFSLHHRNLASIELALVLGVPRQTSQSLLVCLVIARVNCHLLMRLSRTNS